MFWIGWDTLKGLIMPDLDLSAPWSVLKRTSDRTDLVKRTVIWFDVICEYLNFKLIAASNDSMAENANESEQFGHYRAVKVLQEACADLYHPNLDNPSRHLRALTSFHVHCFKICLISISLARSQASRSCVFGTTQRTWSRAWSSEAWHRSEHVRFLHTLKKLHKGLQGMPLPLWYIYIIL